MNIESPFSVSLKYFLTILVLCTSLYSCKTKDKKEVNETNQEKLTDVNFKVAVKELTDSDYPDNPDIGFRHSKYGQFSHDSIIVVQTGDSLFDITLVSGNENSDTIIFSDINIYAFMPIIPRYVQKDEYLKLIGIVNQEWNRHQVRFDRDQNKFRVTNSGSFESDSITRIDIARNCLNSGLWEIIGYAKDKNGASQPYYHGWFDFPLDVYGKLFNYVNPGLNFKDYNDHLVTWTDPRKEFFDLNVLRERGSDLIDCSIDIHNNEYYVEKGARKKKKKNIIYPKKISIIQDFLNDSTTYSTFSPPGCYNTEEPRHTSLGLIYEMTNGSVYNVGSKYVNEKGLKEIELHFRDKTKEKETTIIFGGLDFDKFPTLADTMHHKGYKYPMGIANHSFYETYDVAVQNNPNDNPYYGVIVDKEGHWIDSHFFGIDGPLFFWDAEVKGRLHLYLLSFERHSYVGHFTLDFDE